MSPTAGEGARRREPRRRRPRCRLGRPLRWARPRWRPRCGRSSRSRPTWSRASPSAWCSGSRSPRWPSAVQRRWEVRAEHGGAGGRRRPGRVPRRGGAPRGPARGAPGALVQQRAARDRASSSTRGRSSANGCEEADAAGDVSDAIDDLPATLRRQGAGRPRRARPRRCVQHRHGAHHRARRARRRRGRRPAHPRDRAAVTAATRPTRSVGSSTSPSAATSPGRCWWRCSTAS